MRMGRVSRLARMIRELDHYPATADYHRFSAELGVSYRTLMRYMKDDFSKLQICRCCGRPFGEDIVLGILEKEGVG